MKSTTEPRFIIFGDSHSGVLRRGAEQLGVPYIGAAMFAGKGFLKPFFSVEDGKIVLNSDRESGKFLEMSAAITDDAYAALPILSTAGCNTHRFARRFVNRGFSIEGSSDGQFITSACFEAAIESSAQEVVRFYQALTERGRKLYVAYPPQRFEPHYAKVASMFESVLTRRFLSMGVQMVDVRAKTVDEQGLLQKKYWADDSVHGNDAFGKVVIRRFLKMLGEKRPKTPEGEGGRRGRRQKPDSGVSESVAEE